ncbi:ABC transporter permease [Amycolatopsis panacis]|uniref:ABC transporter permease n=1 Tax=Amycolatopsis panacis TaxID=2340917 RepID=A0A419IAW3_9PSEU|nr:ABC transporter permease [Amycolatopsis panacis]RJQ91195.1 ABC transporter permease [Amycolatopsis panacis]
MGRNAIVAFVARRVLTMVLMLFVISFLIFSLLYLAPGNAVDILLGSRPRTPETVRLLTEQYHLDKPFLTQYWIWLENVLHLDFGTSIQTTLPVADEVKSRLPTSLFLAVFAFVLEMSFGLLFGVLAALKRRGSVDRGLVAVSVVGLSMPAFVSGVLMLYVFAVQLKWFPAFGAGTGFTDQVWHLTLPAISLAIVGAAYVVKHTRAAVISVLDQDYVMFARARGLSAATVMLRYILRNALIPVLGLSAMILSFLVIGAVLVEVTFSVSGIGQMLVRAATSQDLPTIQGVGMLVAAIVMVTNLIADLAYMAADPRVRLRSRK